MNAPLKTPRTPLHPVDPLFLNRWSSRAFATDAITETELLSLIEAARWAPSASNLQPWRFAYALRGDAGFAALAATLAAGNALWAPQAAALVAIASKETMLPAGAEAEVVNPAHAFDAGAAWVSLAYQAHHSGWVAHAMGGFDRVAAAEALHLPAGHVLHAVIAIGRRGDAAVLPEALQAREQPSQRLPLDRIATRGQFPA
ncbi:Nitroreductase family protein [Gemmobacter aquatilis]|uniref:Nitroreductase family protein n=1 Tax=Gemmobacter aquatilis TaxID=933059 RepID=A0A1H8GMD9_9RHOB|nr:nitroreductase family protein [Gemmobacter aquatilis]SEN44904.1 Nitroreductase family protein [Gemmobacter aquatilis]